MKTTLNLDDDLLAAVRELAASRGSTLTSVVEDALRRLLHTPNASREPYRLELPVTPGRWPPAIDVDSNAAIDEYFDRLEWDRAAR